MAVGAAQAEDYPSRPIRVVVGFSPGAVADVILRVMAIRMSQSLGQQLVVENRPGAGSSLGAEYSRLATPSRPVASARTNREARWPVGAERRRAEGRANYPPPPRSDQTEPESGAARDRPRQRASGSGKHS